MGINREGQDPLSVDRAHVEYLLSLDRALKELDDDKLHLLQDYAEAFYQLRVRTNGMNARAAKQLKTEKGASAAGRKSGETRRAKAEGAWRSEALKVAKALREKTPTLSQDALATGIGDTWKKALGKLPRHAALKEFIREKECTGDLAKRTK